MAEKKTEKKKPVSRKNEKSEKSDKKVDKKINTVKKAEKAEPKKKMEAESEVKSERTEEKEVAKLEKRGHGGVVCAVIITFFVTAMLFGMAFFVFMNLDVINDDNRVRIEHGKIYIDNRRRNNCTNLEEGDTDKDDENAKTDTEKRDSKTDDDGKTSTSSGELVDNPNARVSVKGAQLVEVGDFEVFLPKNFIASKANGNGKYVFNLTDDDGWADVKVYAEKTAADLLSYMQRKDSLLRLTDASYYMNGTSWAEMESGSSIAYGTRLGDMLYVVILNVKLESDATGEAEQMIPKTIRLKRIYK